MSNDLLQTRTKNRELIEAANIAYHEAEAELYGASHPEIFWCERSKLQAFCECYLRERAAPTTVVDIGAGTGFVASVLGEFLNEDDSYIATDISPEMLGKLRERFSGAHFLIKMIVAKADDIPLDDATCDVVIISSALHHFPDVDRCLHEVCRLLRPGGIFCLMHEPNIAFASSNFFRQIARAASVFASHFDKVSGAIKPDYASVFAHVNNKLIEGNFVHSPLSPSEIQALVDVHSPTARGKYEAIGFDVASWIKGTFLGWKLESLQTYNFLGKLDPNATKWRRMLEIALPFFFPRHGSLFSLVIRKPL